MFTLRHRLLKVKSDRADEGGGGAIDPHVTYPNFKTVGKKLVEYVGPFGNMFRSTMRYNKNGIAHPQDVPGWWDRSRPHVIVKERQPKPGRSESQMKLASKHHHGIIGLDYENGIIIHDGKKVKLKKDAWLITGSIMAFKKNEHGRYEMIYSMGVNDTQIHGNLKLGDFIVAVARNKDEWFAEKYHPSRGDKDRVAKIKNELK